MGSSFLLMKRREIREKKRMVKVNFFVLSIYSLTAEYLVPNIGMAFWLLYIISHFNADGIYRRFSCCLLYKP